MDLYCPLCREPAANVTLSACDGDTFHCRDCDEEFTRADAAALVTAAANWRKVLAWADECPAHTEAVEVVA